MNSDRYFDGETFPEDFFPGMDGEGEYGESGDQEQDEVERSFELEEKEINQRILFKTVECLERAVRDWNHMKIKEQRKLIQSQFLFYQNLLDGNIDEEEDEE